MTNYDKYLKYKMKYLLLKGGGDVSFYERNFNNLHYVQYDRMKKVEDVYKYIDEIGCKQLEYNSIFWKEISDKVEEKVKEILKQDEKTKLNIKLFCMSNDVIASSLNMQIDQIINTSVEGINIIFSCASSDWVSKINKGEFNKRLRDGKKMTGRKFIGFKPYVNILNNVIILTDNTEDSPGYDKSLKNIDDALRVSDSRVHKLDVLNNLNKIIYTYLVNNARILTKDRLISKLVSITIKIIKDEKLEENENYFTFEDGKSLKELIDNNQDISPYETDRIDQISSWIDTYIDTTTLIKEDYEKNKIQDSASIAFDFLKVKILKFINKNRMNLTDIFLSLGRRFEELAKLYNDNRFNKVIKNISYYFEAFERNLATIKDIVKYNLFFTDEEISEINKNIDKLIIILGKREKERVLISIRKQPGGEHKLFIIEKANEYGIDKLLKIILDTYIIPKLKNIDEIRKKYITNVFNGIEPSSNDDKKKLNDYIEKQTLIIEKQNEPILKEYEKTKELFNNRDKEYTEYIISISDKEKILTNIDKLPEIIYKRLVKKDTN